MLISDTQSRTEPRSFGRENSETREDAHFLLYDSVRGSSIGTVKDDQLVVTVIRTSWPSFSESSEIHTISSPSADRRRFEFLRFFNAIICHYT